MQTPESLRLGKPRGTDSGTDSLQQPDGETPRPWQRQVAAGGRGPCHGGSPGGGPSDLSREAGNTGFPVKSPHLKRLVSHANIYQGGGGGAGG